jgi:hypothetical protein
LGDHGAAGIHVSQGVQDRGGAGAGPSSRQSAGAGTSRGIGPAAGSPLPPAPVTPRQLLQRRETGQAGEGFGCAPSGLSRSQCAHVQAYTSFPQIPVACFDSQDDACYTTKFSDDGNMFVGVPLFPGWDCIQISSMKALMGKPGWWPAEIFLSDHGAKLLSELLGGLSGVEPSGGPPQPAMLHYINRNPNSKILNPEILNPRAINRRTLNSETKARVLGGGAGTLQKTRAFSLSLPSRRVAPFLKNGW